ncbi:hypothetical protein Pst134EA_019539 [Puccinia striiformis f. sp. tritici]|uniref:hypothetical protein n=1 Tax=Puccinia striiformis f. sp. tritici TaxID=168172 RepID=UPI0020084DCF|nr:hypothetical protein Pst134EA_019539 [Puccinia striiformis f. sp. tritici]KAH9449596.1 hypothetical protein Pst134EB_020416 [Puccinia striiformis f. sp. tritici]KAH9459386.1 hypothetical protein Pst134EA_019539 [Puccinia striiformis f. sp. tritici]KAI9618736.1 hypothetical protein KEM48_006499 [Puccinia striiformis f. sp. tritici PST-130]KAI9619038.1 hypothetical protein KEM48_006450 [Puccinia striiformis f. sp. tritici PST-130]
MQLEQRGFTALMTEVNSSRQPDDDKFITEPRVTSTNLLGHDYAPEDDALNGRAVWLRLITISLDNFLKRNLQKALLSYPNVDLAADKLAQPDRGEARGKPIGGKGKLDDGELNRRYKYISVDQKPLKECSWGSSIQSPE